MNSRTTRRFRELFSALPAHVQRQAREAYQLFRADPAHPGLHFKQVRDDPPLDSARVGISYRAVAVRDGNTVVWYWIGSHAAYDQLLAQLEAPTCAPEGPGHRGGSRDRGGGYSQGSASASATVGKTSMSMGTRICSRTASTLG